MKNQDLTPQQERKLRFFEAGILFVLILGIAIFVGAKLGGQGEQEITVATPAVEAMPAMDESVVAAAEIAAEPVAETAAPETTAVAATAPVPAEVTYSMAEQAYFDKDYAGAVALFGRYTDTHPRNAWGFYMLGLSAWKAGDPEAADEALAYALELAPRHVKSLVNHGRVLLDLGRADEAEVRLAAAIELDPAYAEARRVMGRIHHAQARLDEAIASYEDALRLDGDDVWSLNNLGLLLIEQDRCAEALAPLAKAAELDASLACVQNNLGIALERTGHFAAAADAYARALDADPRYAKAEVSRGRVLSLEETPGTVAVDLAALAAGYAVDRGADADLAAVDAAGEPQEFELEVAAAVAPAAATEPAPQQQDEGPDGERNR